MKVVIGLGEMGRALALRLETSGVEVVGVDPSESARAEFTATSVSGRALPDLAELAWSGIEEVFLVVRTVGQVDAVLRALVASPLAPEAAVYVVTTLDVASAQSLATWRTPWSLHELPVSGGRSGALAGELCVLAAPPLSPVRRGVLLATIAHRVIEFADYGRPAAAKLVNNALATYNVLALRAMLAVGSDLGLGETELRGVIEGSSAASWISAHLDSLATDLLVKDVALLERSVGPMPSIGPHQWSGEVADDGPDQKTPTA